MAKPADAQGLDNAQPVMTRTFRRRQQLQRIITGRFFVRFHMTLILGGVFLSGIASSKLLLELGIRSMALRYPLAVTFSYVVFFLLVRIWLWYVLQSARPRAATPDQDSDVLVEVSDSIHLGSSDGGEADETSEETGFSDEAGARSHAFSVEESAPEPAFGSSSGGSAGSSSAGLDIDGEHLVVLIVAGILLILISGVAAYLVYQAPLILSEAAFQAVLASSLIRASRKMDNPGWTGSVFKSTCVPFVVVLAMTAVFGVVAGRYCPEASRLVEVLRGCGSAPE